eukprot:TRINITY_DN2292_c0_g1_i2.p1 TRINITY_DN2292_c0_g1~~TRINITY_DN2292_c0_g1_i2.p1  ORF type:complete len:107 (+),score=20.89 TRINITY_DN2292_c0_g1_i2:267-587(+)
MIIALLISANSHDLKNQDTIRDHLLLLCKFLVVTKGLNNIEVYIPGIDPHWCRFEVGGKQYTIFFQLKDGLVTIGDEEIHTSESDLDTDESESITESTEVTLESVL